jgi:membrane-associated progesterone receptor component
MSLTKIIYHGIRMKIREALGRPDPAASAPVPAAERRDYTAAELAAFDGSDPGLPILLAARGRIFDVTRSRGFYGPGGPYGVFAGRDCSRALATLSTKPEDCVSDLDGLSDAELEKLEDWIDTFTAKYDEIGKVIVDAAAAPR